MGFGVIIFIVHNSIHSLMNFLSLICRIAAAHANRNFSLVYGSAWTISHTNQHGLLWLELVSPWSRELTLCRYKMIFIARSVRIIQFTVHSYDVVLFNVIGLTKCTMYFIASNNPCLQSWTCHQHIRTRYVVQKQKTGNYRQSWEHCTNPCIPQACIMELTLLSDCPSLLHEV